MRAFIVELENSPGELVRVTSTLAAAGVSIRSVAGLAFDEMGAVAIVPDDEDAARGALEEAGLGADEQELIEVSIADAPGALDAVARRLAAADVNVGLLLPLAAVGATVVVGLAVDDEDAARRALADVETAEVPA